MEKLLTIEELSSLLGVEVSTLYIWTHRKTIPFIKLGKFIRFEEAAIQTWLQQKTIEPDQPQPQARTKPNRKAYKTTSGDFIEKMIANAKAGIIQ
jgi:excisionase family DNA binding protein